MSGRHAETVADSQTKIFKKLATDSERPSPADTWNRNSIFDGSDQQSVKEADNFEVERVIGKKGIGPTTSYLIKWLGYDETTWEPVYNLDHCIERVHDFEEREERKRRAAKLGTPPAPRLFIPSTKTAITSLNRRPISPEIYDRTSFTPPHRHSDTLLKSRGSPVYRRAQRYIEVAAPGESGVERGYNVVSILAHKPKELAINGLHDVDFLVSYAGEAPNEFVGYEVCVRDIAAHVSEYLARHPVLPRHCK
ncbi:hypothetical protein BV898_11451 [Hypsibius exemplaris]|uniref:Chromo domain-containing protein n=1 Tax=Hypsibius exemplaris TaxID=2072580 RepID=A0A1W0WGS9_HYPEX|nr:hypothetical protein BV898_11451 [Hypsibius exemplaris]